jgi:hypothetical protein
MRRIGIVLVLLVLAAPVAAGELVFSNGSRLEADLAGGTVLVSTGTDVVEVSPETIGLVTPGEIRLKDGGVLRGTLVGGRLRTRTAMGELAIRVEELQSFRAQGFAAAPAPAPPSPPAVVSAPVPPDSAPAAAWPAPSAPSPTSSNGAQAGPTPLSAAPLRVSTTSGPTAILARPVAGPTLEVVADGSLQRDALTNASAIGRVIRGQTVTQVDAIDRRLHIFNRLIFDGGHWIKVRVGDGTEGWVPATIVREVQ